MAGFRPRLHRRCNWKVWAVASAILLIVCVMCKLVTPADFPTPPKSPESSKFSSSRLEYYNYYISRQHRLSLRRILDDDKPQYARSAPRGYPPPGDNVHTAGEHADHEHPRPSPP